LKITPTRTHTYVEGLKDVGLHGGHGGGGEGHDGHPGAEGVAHLAQFLVLGPKVVAPLRHAAKER
jgi:hypothetical protein